MEIEVKPGEKPVCLVLARPPFSHELVVSHYDLALQTWVADFANKGTTFQSKSRKVLYSQIHRQIMAPVKRSRGRVDEGPKKETTLRLTPAVRLYLDRLSERLQLGLSETVAYLVLKAHEAMVGVPNEVRQIEPILSDDSEWIRAQREATLGAQYANSPALTLKQLVDDNGKKLEPVVPEDLDEEIQVEDDQQSKIMLDLLELEKLADEALKYT